MASRILLKKSSVSDKVPLSTDLAFGELALNYADGRLYYKKYDGTTVDFFESSPSTGGGGSGRGSPNAIDFKTYTATSNQTTFSVTYTAPFVNVYVNGVLLSDTDYTATNGTSVTLSSACSVNDIVSLVGFTSLTIGYGLPLQANNSGKILTTDGKNVSWKNRVTKSATQPLNPLEGDIWFDTTQSVWSIYVSAGDGVTTSGWIKITGSITGTPTPGRGILSIAKTGGTGGPGTTDTYTITYSDSTTSTFTIVNGANGSGVPSISAPSIFAFTAAHG